MTQLLTTKDAAEMVSKPKLTKQDMVGLFKIINTAIKSNRIFLVPQEDFETFCAKNDIELNQ